MNETIMRCDRQDTTTFPRCSSPTDDIPLLQCRELFKCYLVGCVKCSHMKITVANNNELAYLGR